MFYRTVIVITTFALVTSQEIKVETPSGPIVGLSKNSVENKPFCSFLGIPYAEPPKRFEPSTLKAPWTNVFNASENGKVCPQPEVTYKFAEMSEDCLFLNIHTPSIDMNSKLPVLFYIPGGGYFFGSGHSEASVGPEYLLNNDVVLVSLNYRLGLLGFISTATQAAPGNLGLKDIVVALKWVQNNIAAFGGDPSSVTIFGESSGGYSVTLLMVSPMASGLFQKAIVMSGSATNFYKSENQKRTMDLAKEVGCDEENDEKLVDCLRDLPWEKTLISGIFKWYYEVEKPFGQEAFLLEDPNISFEKGSFERIPVMAGITRNEAEFFAYEYLEDADLFKSIQTQPEEEIPKLVMYSNMTFPDVNKITTDIITFYLNGTGFDEENVASFGLLISDSLVNFGMAHFTQLVRKFQDIFTYRFDYQGSFSTVSNMLNTQVDTGVAHTDELQYILNNKMYPKYSPDSMEYEMVDYMTTMWYQFAKTGNPNFGQTPPWEATNSTNYILYHITNESWFCHMELI